MRPGGFGPRGPRSFLTEEEKRNKPKVTKSLIKRILSYLKPYLPQFILVFTALAISAVLGLFPSIITGKIVDEIIDTDRSIYTLAYLLVLAFIVLVLSQVISVLEQYINSWISQKIIFDMKNQMYDHLQRMSHRFFTSEKQGDIITRMNSDINGVSSVISGTLTTIVSNVLISGTCIFSLFYTDWRLAIVGLIILPIMIFPTRAVGKKRWELASEVQEAQDELNQQVDETLSVSGSMLVKLFTRERKEYEKFRNINNRVTNTTIKEHRAGSWFHVMLGMFIQTAPLMIYFAGGFLIISGWDKGLTVGDISVIVALINRLYQPVRQLLNLQVDFVRSLALFTRIFEYYDKPCEITNPENPKLPDITDSTIEFRDVHFSYERNIEILKGVSFTLPSGKMYAIVGASGAGKSTIINMIPRLYDTVKGNVLIAGVDVKEYDLAYLRQNIGVVTQDTYLFNGTIRENLLYAKSDATQDELDFACRAANIYDFISKLPDGYDTIVGNRGLKLSGGEKQRISIARVILKDPKILILDEATSSLDSISENSIQTALDTLMIGRTSLVIAHRLSTVLAADQIMVLQDGTIQDEGTHDELLERSERYRELYETQFRRVLEHERQKNEDNNSTKLSFSD
ncbi:MAG: ABC transporter ATP-binding protein [Ruminococcaceae bacterium]|nr:ABC transporter ATP-binding protein [Oscillospiraceae bacterium]